MTFKKTAMGVAAGLLMSLSSAGADSFIYGFNTPRGPYIRAGVLNGNTYMSADTRGNWSFGQVSPRVYVDCYRPQVYVQQPVVIQQPVYVEPVYVPQRPVIIERRPVMYNCNPGERDCVRVTTPRVILPSRRRVTEEVIERTETIRRTITEDY